MFYLHQSRSHLHFHQNVSDCFIFNFGRSLTIFLCSYDFYVMTTRPSLTFLQHGYIRRQMTPAIDLPNWQTRADWLAGWLSELADEKGWFLCRAARFFPAHAKKTDKIESSEKFHHDNWMGSRPDQDGMYTVQSGRWKWVGWVGIFLFDILGEKTATDTYVIIAHPNSNTSFHRPWNHFPKQNL